MILSAFFALFLGACGEAQSGSEANGLPTPLEGPNTALTEVLTPGTEEPISPSSTPAAEVTVIEEVTPTTAAPSATPEPSVSPTVVEVATQNPTQPAPALGPLPSSGSLILEPVTDGFENPLGLAHPGDGSERLFVVEKVGAIRILQENGPLAAPFLDLRGQVSLGSEQGLLGLAFHPQYAENGFFYVNYTDLEGDSVIARYQVSGDPNQADPGSEKRLLFVEQPYGNHNGGGLEFGPDGYLYISLGDGGSAGDPQGNAQSLDTLLGKLLRIDVDQGEPYAVPPDNPFAAEGGLPEIWAYGLRNPWRFTFDRATGDVFIADVGQNAWEEINFIPSPAEGGLNFGWDYFEGTHSFEGTPPAGAELVDPVYEYNHDLGCSVTGGAVYRGSSLPEWQGVYFFADYCSGNIWGMRQAEPGEWQVEVLLNSGLRVASFGEDEAGEVYVVDLSGGLYRLSSSQ